MKTLARFTIRPAADGRGDLLLGVMFKQQGHLLVPGRVYEMSDVLGTLNVRDVGEAALNSRDARSLLGVSWMHSVDEILETSAGRFILTQQEVSRPRPPTVEET